MDEIRKAELGAFFDQWLREQHMLSDAQMAASALNSRLKGTGSPKCVIITTPGRSTRVLEQWAREVEPTWQAREYKLDDVMSKPAPDPRANIAWDTEQRAMKITMIDSIVSTAPHPEESDFMYTSRAARLKVMMEALVSSSTPRLFNHTANPFGRANRIRFYDETPLSGFIREKFAQVIETNRDSHLQHEKPPHERNRKKNVNVSPLLRGLVSKL